MEDSTELSVAQAEYVERQRVGRLATADAGGQPHVIPVCYAYSVGMFYVALDAKPKRVTGRALKRVRNLLENPQVALVIDHYSDDWSQLSYLLVQGTAALIEPRTAEHSLALTLLRARYPQYVTMPVEENPVISLAIHSVIAWGRVG